jgi:hypothetical protein
VITVRGVFGGLLVFADDCCVVKKSRKEEGKGLAIYPEFSSSVFLSFFQQS